MIHTLELHSPVYKHESLASKRLAQLVTKNVNPLPPIRLYYQVTPDNIHGYFVLHLDAIQIIKKCNIEVTDLSTIKIAINQFLMPAKCTLDDFYVVRVDFCHNAVIENPLIRHCLFDTINRAPMSGPYLYQYGDFPMGILWKNKSREILIYDKPTERTEKNEPLMPYEENIIREEHQLKREHIRNECKRHHVLRKFDAWINPQMYDKYLSKVHQIIAPADFWSVSESIKRIENSSYKRSMKDKLITFVADIATNNNAQDIKKELSCNTYKKYIEMLTAINVNYLAIHDSWTIDYIKNPFY